MTTPHHPRVSVVIPCFNAEPWLEETLASVRAQGLESVEVLLVDDGSTDGSVAVARRALPEVRVLETPRLGPSGARNAGTAAARGEFIQYLDADDLLAPGKLERQLEALEGGSVDVAYGDWQELVRAEGGTFVPGATVRRELPSQPDIAIFTYFWAPPAAYLFRRSVVERVGGWNQGLPIVQDARFVLDCALHGARFGYCPGVAAYYRVHATGSVSTRDPAAFVRDCLRNAEGVHAWWERHGGLSPEWRSAVLNAYGFVARRSFEADRPTFEAAVTRLRELDPGYVPHGPISFRVVARLSGYQNAERLAVLMRRLRRRMRRGASR